MSKEIDWRERALAAESKVTGLRTRLDTMQKCILDLFFDEEEQAAVREVRRRRAEHAQKYPEELGGKT